MRRIGNRAQDSGQVVSKLEDVAAIEAKKLFGVAGGMIPFPELAAAVPAWSDGLCASAASLEARCRSHLRMTVEIRVPVCVTYTMSARSRDVTGDGRLMERARFLRPGLVTPFSGGSGIVPSGTTTRGAGRSA